MRGITDLLRICGIAVQMYLTTQKTGNTEHVFAGHVMVTTKIEH